MRFTGTTIETPRAINVGWALLVASGLCACGSSTPSESANADGGRDASDTTNDGSGDVVISVPLRDAAMDANEESAPDSGTETGDAEGGASCDAATSLVCGTQCVDKETDQQNCNGCGHVCPGPDSGTGAGICVNGACQLSCASDGGTSLLCPSGECVDPTSTSNCGSCGTVCAAPASNGTATCSGSPLACGISCASGYHASGGASCNTSCAANTDDPSGDPCAVADGLGIFVAPTGSDAAPGDGSKEHPFGTIDHAMTTAASGTKRVYACGTFTAQNQAVTVTSTTDGVSVYGGFDCTTWAYSASTPTKVAPTTAGYALQVSGATTGVTFQDFEFDAIDAPQTASATPASSIAVFASGSVLTLTRVTVKAGAGQPGEGGGTNSNYTGATAPGGGSGTLTVGGPGPTNTCSDGSQSEGGDGAGIPSPPAQDGSSQPAVGIGNGGLSGASSCATGGSGASGGSAGSQGAGVALSGSLGASGWTVAGVGGSGAKGKPGQGGGGGGSNATIGAGGGGGAGGCGGGEGTGGATGGSSIAVLAYDSTLTLTSSSLTTGIGGGGGSGGPGQAGQGGGGGGQGGGGAPHGCSGGGGGDGSQGSGGGGGAGGLSSGIVWTGTAGPSFNGATYTTQATVTGITLGAQGAGGGNGTTPAANAVFKSN